MRAWEGTPPHWQTTSGSLSFHLGQALPPLCPAPLLRAAHRNCHARTGGWGEDMARRQRGRQAGGRAGGYLGCWWRPAGSPTTSLPDRLPSPRDPTRADNQVKQAGCCDPLSLRAGDSDAARWDATERRRPRPVEMTSHAPRPPAAGAESVAVSTQVRRAQERSRITE